MKKYPLFLPVEQTGKFPKSADMSDLKNRGFFPVDHIQHRSTPLFCPQTPVFDRSYFPVRKWRTIPLSGIPGISNFRGYYNNGRGGTT
jgi:hypothetical protein